MVLHVETPLIRSIPMEKASGRQVFLKMDALQPAGSFKLRGIGRLCEEKAKEGVNRFISSSGGNAGYAAAWAAKELDLSILVVVPETTSQEAINAIRSLGGEVRVHGANWNQANELVLSLLKEDPKSAYVHPYDNPIMWKGHGTIIDEAFKQGSKPDAIVLSVGGGGLLSGVVEGLNRNGWSDVPVVACETEGTASFAGTFKAGRIVKLKGINSVATSLGATSVTPHVLEILKTNKIRSFVGSDKWAVSACRKFLDDHRVLVEPACGTALSAVYENSPVLEDAGKVMVVVCGGIGISFDKLSELEKKFL